MKTHLNTFVRLACILSGLIASPSQAQVGMRQIQSGDMPVTLVYPTEAVARTVVRGPFTLEAAWNAPPTPAAPGSRKLVVLSHGTAGSPEPDFQLAATLARAGFVVAQPLHRGDNFRDFSKAGPESWKTRPQDVSDTITALGSDALLGPHISTQQVGVHGMSAGGVTGLAMAGAQWRMLNLMQHCAQHLDEDIGFCLNGLAQQPLQKSLRKGQFAMGHLLTETRAPDGFKRLHGGQMASASTDPRPDPRVAAVSLMVPVAVIFTPESLSRIRIPVGLTTAGKDGVLAPGFHSQQVLQHCTRCALLSDHPEAGHFDWLSPWPTSVAQTVATTQMRGGLPNPAFSNADRQKAFDQIALFFKQQL